MGSFDDAERRLARKLGSQMRGLRERKGWTQRTLARKAGHYSRSTIATVETGSGKCSLKLVQGCDDALGAGGELVNAYFQVKEAQAQRKEGAQDRAPDEAADSGPDTMVICLPVVMNGGFVVMPLSLPRRKVLTAGAAGILAPLTRLLDPDEGERIARTVGGRSRADVQVVEHLEALLAQYRKLDDLMGPRHVHGPMQSLCGLVERLCETAEGSVQQALLSVAAQCQQFNGFLWSDGGHQSAGERSYEAAISRATAAGNQALAGYLLAWRAHHALLQGKAPTAIALTQEAQTGKWQLTPAVRALAAAREACGWALQGNRDRCKHKLDESSELLAKSIGEDEPPWIYWFGEEYVAIHRGVCLTDAGDAESAIETLDRAIAALPRDRIRDRGDFLSCLAKAHARNDDLEQASALARESAQAAIETGSAGRLEGLRRLHAELDPQIPAVKELGELLEQAAIV